MRRSRSKPLRCLRRRCERQSSTILAQSPSGGSSPRRASAAISLASSVGNPWVKRETSTSPRSCHSATMASTTERHFAPNHFGASGAFATISTTETARSIKLTNDRSATSSRLSGVGVDTAVRVIGRVKRADCAGRRSNSSRIPSISTARRTSKSTSKALLTLANTRLASPAI